MSIPSITANPLPAALVQPGGKVPAQAEIRAENLPDGKAPAQTEIRAENLSAAKTRNLENQPQARPDDPENEEEVRAAVDDIERFVAQSVRDITFSIDKDAGFMVKVIDRASQDVILQIPSDEVIAIARALDKLQGLFVRDKI